MFLIKGPVCGVKETLAAAASTVAANLLIRRALHLSPPLLT